MHTYKRLFGSGPLGAFYGLVLFMAAIALNETFGLPKIINNELHRYIIFGLSTFITILIIIWSLLSLPPSDRGKELVISGAFKYFRHPLYAAFISVFNFGFAVIMNNWIYLIWALLMIPVWQICVRSEEQFMLEKFGESYIDYCASTWRFFPKLYNSKYKEKVRNDAQ